MHSAGAPGGACSQAGRQNTTPCMSVQEDVHDGHGRDGLDMVGGDGEGVLDQQPVAERPPQRHEGDGDGKRARSHDRKLHRRLTAFPNQPPYNPLIPSAMAFQSS